MLRAREHAGLADVRSEHIDVIGTQRAPVWEIHPIMKIGEQQRVELDHQQ
jgi:hypothetical protein